MKRSGFIYFLSVGLLLLSIECCKNNHGTTAISHSTTKHVGGGCDGCELMYTGIPAQIDPIDTSIAWFEEKQRLLIKGTVYKLDGKTPAPGIIVYYYHTDYTGNYSKRNDKPANQTKHGHIRGWIKTGNDGRYAIYTSRPSPYPGHSIPSHIHVIIKEPGMNEYYIDEFVFDDDSILTEDQKQHQEQRAGNGILKVSRNAEMQVADHDIILGLNIPGYPGNKK